MAGAFHILKAIHHLLPLGARRISSPALLVLPSSLSGFSSSSCSAVTDLSLPHGNDTATAAAEHTAGYTDRQALYNSRVDDPEYRRWKVREAEILEDIEPITLLAKDILHSDSRYQDGECLTDEDEKIVVERLLAYHPHSEDKIGFTPLYTALSWVGIMEINIVEILTLLVNKQKDGFCYALFV
ncbi:hypothetical protein ACLOJK_000836 [Asimina triloba]